MLTLVIARNDLTRRVRNRSALFTAFVGPLAMAVVFGLLLGGTSSATFTIGVVDADGSETSRSLAGGLVGGGPASADPTDGDGRRAR